MEKKIGFAIIGCGRIGTRQSKKMELIKNAKLVAVCDIDKNAGQKIADKYNCKFFEDYKKMLKTSEIDVVNVCTPNYLHKQMTVDSLNAGKHVLCEKPMSLTINDADEMIDAEKKNGKKLFIVKQNRYNPPVAKVKNLFKEKKLGKIVMINSTILWNRNDEYYEQSDWRGTKDMDGGTLYTQVSHFLDLVIWFGGPVKSVYAKMDNYLHNKIEIEDTGSIMITFEDGAMGMLQYTTCTYEKNCEGSITVLGEKGTVKIGGEYLNTIEFWKVKEVPCPEINCSRRANDYGTYKGSMSNHDLVLQNVVDALQKGEPPSTPSIDGRRSVEVMQAAYMSAKQGKEIFLPIK